MNTFCKTLLATVALCAVLPAYAAKPTSIKYVEEVVMADDQIWAHYVVKCSNGQDVDLSAWDNRKLWCVGKASKDACNKKQIKAAKDACKE